MKIAATQYPVSVDYRVKGKTYLAQSNMADGEPVNNADVSSYHFDTVVLQPGQEFEVADATVVNVREHTPSEAPSETPNIG